jgi:hypothetical protein
LSSTTWIVSICGFYSTVYSTVNAPGSPGLDFETWELRGHALLSIPRYNLHMKRSAAEVLEDVRRLPPGDVDWLIGELLQGGDGSSDAEIEASWKAEVEQRVVEIDSGAVEMLPLEDVLARMDARILARHRE